MFKDIFRTYGIPKNIKTDCRQSFTNNKNESEDNPDSNSKMPVLLGLKMLGINLQTSTKPEFKPHIERFWKTLKMNIQPFITRNNIDSLEKLNSMLNEFKTILINMF